MLTEYVAQGRLKPGERVLAKDLSKRLGMGRTPVREALLRLQIEGIIICNSRHSYNVRILTQADVKEIYDTLGILEGAVAGSVAQIITPKDLDQLRDYNSRMWQAAEKGDLSTFGQWNREFHGLFLARHGNQMVHNMCDAVRRQLYAYPVKGVSLCRWLEKSVREHQQIIRLVRNHDGKKLESYFREVHWSFTKNLNYIKDAFHPDGQFPVPF